MHTHAQVAPGMQSYFQIHAHLPFFSQYGISGLPHNLDVILSILSHVSVRAFVGRVPVNLRPTLSFFITT